MTADDTHRFVTIDRDSKSHYTVTNARGGTIAVGNATGTDFTPVELLLAGIGGCTAVDVDLVTSRRAEPDSFRVEVEATKVSDAQGHRLTDIVVTFKVAFPDSEGGEAAREVLPGIAAQSHDRLCTVSRTVEIGTPITTRIE